MKYINPYFCWLTNNMLISQISFEENATQLQRSKCGEALVPVHYLHSMSCHSTKRRGKNPKDIK